MAEACARLNRDLMLAPAVLQRNDGKQFDQNLVRRFVQLVGLYPAGNLVRLQTGEIAVVLEVHAPDAHRPRVRILMDKDRRPLERPRDVNPFDLSAEEQNAVREPLDPAEFGIDPLVHLQESNQSKSQIPSPNSQSSTHAIGCFE